MWPLGLVMLYWFYCYRNNHRAEVPYCSADRNPKKSKPRRENAESPLVSMPQSFIANDFAIPGYANMPDDLTRLSRDNMYAKIAITAACRKGLYDVPNPHTQTSVGCVIRTSAKSFDRRQVQTYYSFLHMEANISQQD